MYPFNGMLLKGTNDWYLQQNGESSNALNEMKEVRFKRPHIPFIWLFCKGKTIRIENGSMIARDQG